MRKNYLFLLLLVASTAFCQIDSNKKVMTDYLKGMTKDNILLQKAEVIQLYVNGDEIKKPEDFPFDLSKLKDLPIVRNENIEKDENRTSYTIMLKTVSY